jgi:uncharacterized membrane protein HdeD (DUF308 family)
MLSEYLARHWWVLALRGLAAVVFGILAFVWPGITLAVLVLFWGAYALVDGVLALLSVTRAAGDRRWALILEGVVGVAAGVLTFIWPGMTALVLLFIIAAWAIVTGIFELIEAVRLREQIQNEWLLGLMGIASITFGVILAIAPGAGALAVVWLIGSYALVFGILMIGLAFRLRGFAQRHPAAVPA